MTATPDITLDITLDAAWERLCADPRAVLVDVRTRAEWDFVGVADLDSIGKTVRFVEWIDWPDRTPNPKFVEAAGEGLDADCPILLLCRSGARSAAAGRALAAAGFTSTFNVVAGFEGDLGDDGHRRGGWKDSGLPWRQA